jgi:hypothetical protein
VAQPSVDLLQVSRTLNVKPSKSDGGALKEMRGVLASEVRPTLDTD